VDGRHRFAVSSRTPSPGRTHAEREDPDPIAETCARSLARSRSRIASLGVPRDIMATARAASTVRKLLLPVGLKSLPQLEACPERLRQSPEARRRPHEGERLEPDANDAGADVIPDHNLHEPILERRVEPLLCMSRR
jgi:hypothetical protein